MCLMSSYKRDFLLIKSLQCSWMGFLLLLLKVHYYVFPNLSCHLESLPSLCLLLWSKSAGNLLTEQLRFLGRPVQLRHFFASVSNFSSFLSLFLSSFAWRREVAKRDKRQGSFPALPCRYGDWTLFSVPLQAATAPRGSFLHMLFFQALLKYSDHLFSGICTSSWLILKLQNTRRQASERGF